MLEFEAKRWTPLSNILLILWQVKLTEMLNDLDNNRCMLVSITDTVKFDNSNSLRKSKCLDYWVEVLEPILEHEAVGFQEPMRFDQDKD